MRDDIFDKCDIILCEIYKFTERMRFLGESINDDRLESFENQINFLLPFDFKYILKKHNGLSLNGIEVYGISEEQRGLSLDKVYRYERERVSNKIPYEYLPFSGDGRGNHYCLDLSRLKSGICPIIFWQWDYMYDSWDEVETCNESFIDWMEEVMIGWTIQDYDYDGTFKS